MTGVCPAQNPRTHQRIVSARGLLSPAPRRMLPPLDPATTGTFPIPRGTVVKLGLPDDQVHLCRNLSGPSVVVPKCQSVSMEKSRRFSWSPVSTVMPEGWGWLYLMGCPKDTFPWQFSQDQNCQDPWVPLTACVVLASQVAALLALGPHPVQAGSFVNVKKGGLYPQVWRENGVHPPHTTRILRRPWRSRRPACPHVHTPCLVYTHPLLPELQTPGPRSAHHVCTDDSPP